jgi:hypothetical protein
MHHLQTGAVFKSLPFLLSQNQPLASELARKWSTQLAQLLTSRHNRSSSSSSSNRSRGRSTGLEGSGGQQSAWDPEGEFLADVLKPITDGATGSTSSSSRGGDSRTGPPSGLNTNAAHRLQLWDGLTTDTLLQLLESLAHNRCVPSPCVNLGTEAMQEYMCICMHASQHSKGWSGWPWLSHACCTGWQT